MPVAGEGAPWVAEFSVTEFAAALGMSHRCGEAVRRPRPRAPLPAAAGVEASPWTVACGRGWRGGSPRRPSCSSQDAASFVDRHVAPTAHRIGPVQLDRLVDEAIGRYMPAEAERRRLEHADGRYFTVESRQVHSYDGTLAVHGELDIADAMELETAIQTVAAQLKDLGSTESLDVRRSMAVGELAGVSCRLELSVVEEGAPRPSRNHPRKIVLYVHLSQDALTARLEHGNHLITPGQLRDLCDAAEPGDRETRPRPDRPRPGRHPRRTGPAPRAGRGPRPDLRLPLVHPPRPSCDADHTVPAARGGPTCPCNEGLTLPPATIASRRSPAGPTPPSTPAPISGRAHTATATCATRPAPTTSPQPPP